MPELYACYISCCCVSLGEGSQLLGQGAARVLTAGPYRPLPASAHLGDWFDRNQRKSYGCTYQQWIIAPADHRWSWLALIGAAWRC